MERPIIVVEYDSRWPFIYEDEKALIVGAIGDKILAIEHFGSTAVPGLSAKPIIDILAGVRSPEDADECLKPLSGIGYTDVTANRNEDPDWYYCLGRKPENMTTHLEYYHLHLVRYESDFWKRQLVFRDILRSNPEIVRQYYELKKELAVKYRNDRLNYVDAKKSFIESVLARTEASSRE